MADDGDPLDALVLMDEPAFCGCLIESRLIGVIEAEQSEDGKTERNDRLIAVAAKSQTHAEVKSLSDVSPALLKEIEHFFISYNQARGKKFRPIGRRGPKRAAQLLKNKNVEANVANNVKGRFDALFDKEQIQIVAEIRNPSLWN